MYGVMHEGNALMLNVKNYAKETTNSLYVSIK
jgi:hypothetical protein